jgi:hypothetical protein
MESGFMVGTLARETARRDGPPARVSEYGKMEKRDSYGKQIVKLRGRIFSIIGDVAAVLTHVAKGIKQ